MRNNFRLYVMRVFCRPVLTAYLASLLGSICVNCSPAAAPNVDELGAATYSKPSEVYSAFKSGVLRKDWSAVFYCYDKTTRNDLIIAYVELCHLDSSSPIVARIIKKHGISNEALAAETARLDTVGRKTANIHQGDGNGVSVDVRRKAILNCVKNHVEFFSDVSSEMPQEVSVFGDIYDLKVQDDAAVGKMSQMIKQENFVDGVITEIYTPQPCEVRFVKEEASWRIRSISPND